jgi:hypothetical protein
MTICIGIDPGVSGAISFIDHRSAVVVDLPSIEIPGAGRSKRKLCGRGLAEIIRRHVPAGEEAMVVLEDVHAMPSSASGSGANTSLMHSKGVIEGVLGVLRLDIQLINSRTWKRFYGLTSDKGLSLEAARRLWPELATSSIKLAKHHNRAESLLLANFGLRKLT